MSKHCSYVLFMILLNSASNTADNANCESDKCFQSVKTSLLEFKNSTNIAIKVPFDDSAIRTVTTKIESVTTNTKELWTNSMESKNKLRKCRPDKIKYEKLLKEMIWKIGNITKGDDNLFTLEEIKAKHSYLETVLYTHKNVSNTCSSAESDLTKLKNLLNSMEESDVNGMFGDIAKRTRELNKNLNETFEESLKNKNKIQGIKVPGILTQNHLQNMLAMNNKSISYIMENANILEELIDELNTKDMDDVKLDVENLKGLLSTLQHDVNHMNSSINHYMKLISKNNYSLSITDEMRQELGLLKTIYQDQKNKAESIRISLEILINKLKLQKENTLKSIHESTAKIQKETELFTEYIKFLDVLPASKDIKNIQFELTKLKHTMNLIRQKNQLSEDLRKIRELHKEMIKYPCPLPDRNILQ